MRTIILLAFGWFCAGMVYAQVGSSISSDGTTPNINAMLDVQSPATGDGKGMLIPRVTENQRTNANASLAGGLLDDSGNLRGGAAHGLIVYQTDGIQGLYFNTSQTAMSSWALLGMDDSSVSIGPAANGSSQGAAVGLEANGYNAGAAAGYLANGSSAGAAVGCGANGRSLGAAVGYLAKSTNSGAAVGYYANGSAYGAAMGYWANGYNYGVAIGYKANAKGGTERIAIGHNVTNEINNTAAIRGHLYLDGGTGVWYRSTFGNGSWTAKAFEIDHPLDPQNKILRHFCLEGPQVWNVYAGNAQLVNGQAVAELPDYYSALNLVGSEICSLTPWGRANVWVARGVDSNTFSIAGDADVKVSWTIKVLRNDPACLEDLQRRPVEQRKSEIVKP